MKPLTLLAFVCISFTLFSQHSISFQAGGYAGYRHLTADDDFHARLIRDLRTSEVPGFRPSFTIALHTQLEEAISWSVGLQYAVYGFRTENPDSLRWGNQVNPDGTYNPSIPSGEEIEEVRFGYHYNFIGTPIAMRFSHREKKWRGYTQLGCTPLVYLSASNTQISNVGTKSIRHGQKPDTFNHFRIAAHIAVGIERRLHENLSFFLQPTLHAMVIPAYNEILNEWLYTGGLEAGVRKHLHTKSEP